MHRGKSHSSKWPPMPHTKHWSSMPDASAARIALSGVLVAEVKGALICDARGGVYGSLADILTLCVLSLLLLAFPLETLGITGAVWDSIPPPSAADIFLISDPSLLSELAVRDAIVGLLGLLRGAEVVAEAVAIGRVDAASTLLSVGPASNGTTEPLGRRWIYREENIGL